MKMSTKGRYGLRAMLDLALNSGGDHVALNTIAERQNISSNYLEQVFSILRKAGLVKSVKGAQEAMFWLIAPIALQSDKFSGHWKGICLLPETTRKMNREFG